MQLTTEAELRFYNSSKACIPKAFKFFTFCCEVALPKAQEHYIVESVAIFRVFS